MSDFEMALKAACEAYHGERFHDAGMRAAMLAYEAALWRSIEEAPSGDSVMTQYADGTIKIEIADGALWRMFSRVSGRPASIGHPVRWRHRPTPPSPST